jgi:hypothetical protein
VAVLGDGVENVSGWQVCCVCARAGAWVDLDSDCGCVGFVWAEESGPVNGTCV